ncbi:MAG: DNA repair exonuclease [Nitrososphaerota archaeon]|nr:DNA repair exonuclease [Nitrososphaerota archaeon]
MGRFAHISDSHIGAWRDPILRGINDRAFASAVDLCLESQVDFVVISGDIFDVGLPEMNSVRSAVRKLRELAQHNIAAYVVYGSHDYSPTTVSVVDVLTSAGLFVNVAERTSAKDGVLELGYVEDEKSGALISGLPGRRGGLEKNFYSKHEFSIPVNEDRFSVFLFHASISELQSLNIPTEESVSLKELPKGFSYYAGGHIHKRARSELDGSPVIYPGPLFGTNFVDLESVAKGEGRGVFLVEFQGSKATTIDFKELKIPKVFLKNFSADSKSTSEVEREVSDFVSKPSFDVLESIVLLKIKGTLASGRSSDIDWYQYRQKLIERGAAVVNINRLNLLSQETKRLANLGAQSKEEIESKLFKEHLKEYKPQSRELEHLSSDSGIRIASNLLKALKTEKKEEETRQDFENRVWRDASAVMRLPEKEV